MILLQNSKKKAQKVLKLAKERTPEKTKRLGGEIFTADEILASSFSNAGLYCFDVDQAIEAILRQIRKNKTRLEKKLKEGAFKTLPEEPVEREEEIPEFKVRTKSFTVKPMAVEDAILQMLLLEHDFFLFRDVKTGELNVVYKKIDGDYGLIIPD